MRISLSNRALVPRQPNGEPLSPGLGAQGCVAPPWNSATIPASGRGPQPCWGLALNPILCLPTGWLRPPDGVFAPSPPSSHHWAVGALVAAGLCAGLSRADDFSDNLAKWQAKRPAHYEYQYARACFCQSPTWLVEAEGGTVVKAEIIDTSSVSSFPTESPDNLAIDSVFAWLKAARERNSFEVKVKYDPDFGYPISAYVDRSDLVSDEELTILISGFKVIPVGLVHGDEAIHPAPARPERFGTIFQAGDQIYDPKGRSVPRQRIKWRSKPDSTPLP
jgi:hypothetical protein